MSTDSTDHSSDRLVTPDLEVHIPPAPTEPDAAPQQTFSRDGTSSGDTKRKLRRRVLAIASGGFLRPARSSLAGDRSARPLGGGQFQGDAIDPHAARPTGHRSCGRLSTPQIDWPRGQYSIRRRCAIQPIPAGKCHGQLHQGPAARSGEDCLQ